MNETKICKGCGAVLQNEFPGKAGYVMKAEQELCQRCFRIRHYNDLTINMLDEITNVFTLGQMGFSLFTDSDYDPTVFPLGTGCYDILMKAISPERENRFRTIAEFEIHWLKEIKGDKYV